MHEEKAPNLDALMGKRVRVKTVQGITFSGKVTEVRYDPPRSILGVVYVLPHSFQMNGSDLELVDISQVDKVDLVE